MRVFSPVGESLCLWATLPCVFVFPSIWLHSPSDVDYHFSHVSARSINPFSVLVTITHSVSDFSRLSFSVILAQKYIYICVCVCVFLSGFLWTLQAAGERVFVCGPSSDLLWAGLDQLSCQAAAWDPPRLFVTVQVWQTQTLPAQNRPLHVHTLQLLLSCAHTHTQKSLGFRLHIKKRPVHILLMPAV